METSKKIDELTIEGTVYVPKQTMAVSNADDATNGKPCVLIRSYAAGVHFGYLAKEEFTPSGKVVLLLNTRRVWYWDGAASLSQMANEGVKTPANCKFSMPLASNEIVNVIETIPLTDKAMLNLYGVAIWKK